MKNEETQNGPASAEEVRALLDACKVSELQACKRAGIATSTVLRWKRGSQPKPGQLDVLRLSIMEIASDAGNLPNNLSVDLDQLRQTSGLPPSNNSHADIASRVDRLERVVTEQLGASL